MTYSEYKVNLTEGQTHNLTKLIKWFNIYQLVGSSPLMKTKTQINYINIAKINGVGLEVTVSKTVFS